MTTSIIRNNIAYEMFILTHEGMVVLKVYNGPVDCSPEEVGYSGERLDAVNAFFSRLVDDQGIFGVMYQLARQGRVFASAALGSRHYNNPELHMQPQTTFRIASQTKVFTAIAIMMLYEDGLISFEDSIARYIPQFGCPPYVDITLFHLLTHTSGLYCDAGSQDKHHMSVYDHIDAQNEKDGINTDWIAAGLRAGLCRKPGTEWLYSSFGFTVLGAVVEAMSGMKYEDFIMDRICKPLGMNETVFDLAPDVARNTVVYGERSERQLNDIEMGKKKDNGVWDIIPRAAGGLYSTTGDMARLGMMLQNWGRLGDVRILGRKSVENMATQRLHGIPDFCWGARTAERQYGLGVDMRRFPVALTSPNTYFHEGAGYSVLIVDPTEEMVCSCAYPAVDGNFNDICNNRLFNVIWSGL